MTPEHILNYIRNHPAGKVKIAFTDIDGILRGKYISTAKLLSILEDGLGFCDVIFGWDSADLVYDNAQYTGWHTGYPDAPARIDDSTFRKIPWEGDLPFFLGDISPRKEDEIVCSRQLLKKISGQVENEGFEPMFAQEFEWFNFSETPASAQQKQFSNLTPLTGGMFGYSILRSSLRNEYMTGLFEMLGKFGIPIEGLHTETGPGVYEAAIAYSGLLEAADRAVLFKSAVKEIAYKHGVMATFMAKVSESLPGCGGHIHQSLREKSTGQNIFYDESDPGKMSAAMKSYIAGQLHCLPFILPMFAPTINSYKRLVEGAWAPITLTWGIDNRTVAVRALPGGSKSTRVETRVVGSDVNPYLAMAAALASGWYGMKKKLSLQPATIGNGYLDNSYGRLPGTLHEATVLMKESPLARELFGDAFVDHFVRTREWEWRQHLKAVTDWEMRRYFEII